jgi:hypothetical protein
MASPLPSPPLLSPPFLISSGGEEASNDDKKGRWRWFGYCDHAS